MSKHPSKTRKRQESSEKSTLLVRSGSAVVRVYTQQRKGKRLYTVAWYTGGKRHRQFCRTLEQAQKFAKAQADQISAGTAQSARISMVDAQNLREAQRHLTGQVSRGDRRGRSLKDATAAIMETDFGAMDDGAAV